MHAPCVDLDFNQRATIRRCVLVVGDGFDVGVVCVMMSQHWGGGGSVWGGLGVLVVEVGHVQCSGYDIPSNPTMVQ